MVAPDRVPPVVHRHVGGSRQRLALPHHSLRERRRSLPHPVPDRSHLHRQSECAKGGEDDEGDNEGGKRVGGMKGGE